MNKARILSMLLVLILVSSIAPALADGIDVSEGSWTKNKDKPITIKWFAAYDWYSAVFDPINNIASKVILEDTGITIEMSSGTTDKLNMLITTDSLPDIITMDAPAAQRKLLEDSGRLAPLEPLIKEHAPDMNVPQSMLDWYRNKDGNSYIIASYFFSEERTSKEYGGFFVTHNYNFARSDVLDKIGMTYSDLRTPEGMLNALRAVKEKNIQYNDKPMIPLGALGHSPAGGLVQIANQFGWKPEDSEGKLTTAWRAPEYLEALKWANTVYREGLMPDDVFTWNEQQRREATANGSVFAGIGWTGIYSDARRSLYAADNNAKMLCAGTMDRGDKSIWYPGVNCAGWTGTMINANSEHKDRIIQLFSYLTSDIATLNTRYGTHAYTLENGKVKLLPEAQELFDNDPSTANAKYKFDMTFLVDWTIIQKYWPELSTTNEVERDIQLAEMNKDINIYDDKCFSGLDPDAGTDLAATLTIINDEWLQAIPQMIMASSPEECEQIWKTSLETVDSLGFPEVEAYRQERFAENKTRLGLEFAYPGNR